VSFRFFCGVAAASAALAFASSANANGRIPASSAFAFDPSTQDTIYMRTTFGMLVSHDGGHAWDWICERTLGFSGPEDPSIGVFSNGTVAATLFEGLAVTQDKACTFNLVQGALAKQVFIDIAVKKKDPTKAVVITSGYANMTDDAGNALFSNKVFISTDSGATWTQKGNAIDPSLLLETIDWSDVDPNRMYVSGGRGSGASVQGVILESDDGGGTWTEHSLPLVAKERAPFIAALDPKSADALYVRTGGSQTDGARLLVSTDAGKSWKEILKTTGPMLGFALSEDGSKIFAGGPGAAGGSVTDGVLAASTTDFMFTKKSSIQIQCLAYRAGQLWACSNEFSGFTAGVSMDDGATFEPRLHLSDVRGPLSCPPGTPTEQFCTADWPMLAMTLGVGQGDASVDASSSDAADGGATSTHSGGGGGGCSLDVIATPTAATTGILGALGSFVGLMLRRRKRR
jgi:photosystem II stability/assembly factor-like uncharacterized protein